MSILLTSEKSLKLLLNLNQDFSVDLNLVDSYWHPYKPSILIDTLSIEELGVDITPRLTQLQVIEPPKRSKGVMVSDVAELVQKLKHEAKVI